MTRRDETRAKRKDEDWRAKTKTISRYRRHGCDIDPTRYVVARKNCKDGRACRITGRNLGLIRKYDIMLCRQAFRENAAQIGFVKYR